MEFLNNELSAARKHCKRVVPVTFCPPVGGLLTPLSFLHPSRPFCQVRLGGGEWDPSRGLRALAPVLPQWPGSAPRAPARLASRRSSASAHMPRSKVTASAAPRAESRALRAGSPSSVNSFFAVSSAASPGKSCRLPVVGQWPLSPVGLYVPKAPLPREHVWGHECDMCVSLRVRVPVYTRAQMDSLVVSDHGWEWSSSGKSLGFSGTEQPQDS